ncbi:nucleotidyltransferase family protein [Pseudoalteromonas sp. SCSIO 43201]|uniref:N-acetylmuramate alpha-1-phosphate uridylyltransferase MurU n=1 Tax=Pseudoalteromonas sp. SCSIO 43201 TaxID=2822842 RepID=UPI002075795F|nr:nucleotidyltransferase family protein [Pseudoalteromonas sp. SCSIO 43201]USD27902.1 nucleotidyltransferase family protein [Pseudoalteromonas sp. SCSIO 43201]
MKAIILSAGRGKRMMPLTATQPKPMLKVAGKPLIEHHIERLKLAGITEVVINLAWHGEVIKHYFGDGSHFGVNITYSDEPEGGLETAGGIIQALPLLCQDSDRFVVINGDIFTDYDVRSLIQLQLGKAAAGHCEAHIVLVENPVHNPNGDFCLAHQPLNQEQYTFSGIGIYHQCFFAGLERGFVKLGPLLRSALAEHRVSTELYLGQWDDIGTPERLSTINKKLGYSDVG